VTAAARRRALLIGIEHYADQRFSRLASTRADLQQLGDVLNDRAIGGFEVRVEPDLLAGEMRTAIEEFCRERNPDELALVYISGHGARIQSGEFVFVASDTDAQSLKNTAITASVVNECLEDCFAGQKIAILDCCRSGGFALGFQTRVSKSVREEPVPRGYLSPLTPTGVYVLSSSDLDQDSFAGDGTLDDPEPSVFTGALVDVLRSGRAGTSASGLVSVDDLFDAVSEQLRRATPRQTPVKSAIRVSGRIPIAARPLGGAPRPTRTKQSGPMETGPESGRAPGWPELLAYYRHVVRAEMGTLPLLPVAGDGYVCLPDREKVLSGDTDDDGCVPLPPEAGHYVTHRRSDDGQEWWVGWPAVVLQGEPGKRRSSTPYFAPLLMRQVEVTATDGGTRLRPIGPVVPHPGLAHHCLGEEEAAILAATYQPTWHHGESARMAEDAGHLLRDDFALPAVEELRPDLLTDHIDTATPLAGARNAAVLFTIAPTAPTKGLQGELEQIAEQPTAIAETALAALFPGAAEPPSDAANSLVTPKAANPAQRAVLTSAMTRRLTVATGPPGTGKSQLVVDAVATGIAAGQSVLVASTNNQAVNEVWRRCEEILPGLLIRTGNREAREEEAAGLQALLHARPPERTPETREAAFRRAHRQLEAVETDLRKVAKRETELLALGRARAATEQRLERSADELQRTLGPGWGDRARAVARARWWAFGELRRRRFLQRADLVPGPEGTAQLCRTLADLAEADDRWRNTETAVQSAPSDDELIRRLNAVQQRLEEASTELVAGTVQDRAIKGQRQIAELRRAQEKRAQENGKTDWGEFRRALPYIPGWAVTNLSARRFPFGARLFDLVIIDEASQCSIPSIVPLLFRARRALVIGDAMQLPHISSLQPEGDAVLRKRHDVSRHWLAENRLSPVRHSAFAAAEHAAGGSVLLNEHYRCHPEIAAIPNRLFYQGKLAILTDVRGHSRVNGPSILWHHVHGRAERGHNGTSWRNQGEVDQVIRCVNELLTALPQMATIGVVTPYRPQSMELAARLENHGDRVRVGTAHTFQGGECDVIILSLVAGDNASPRAFDWADQQRELWNVAITRPRSHLIIVGDENVWARRGGVGGALLAAARSPETAGSVLDVDTADRLYAALVDVTGASVELGVPINGYRADALLTSDTGPRPCLVDPGAVAGVDPVTHLSRMLRRRTVLGDEAIRIPAWWLYDSDDQVAERIQRAARPLSVPSNTA
jgi:hypothetical protein